MQVKTPKTQNTVSMKMITFNAALKALTLRDYLTINSGRGLVNQKISAWIDSDAVLLHKTLLADGISLDRLANIMLMNKLRMESPAYYRSVKGLDVYINFPGYEGKVKAIVPYTECPERFWAWYRTHHTKVCLSNKELHSLQLTIAA